MLIFYIFKVFALHERELDIKDLQINQEFILALSSVCTNTNANVTRYRLKNSAIHAKFIEETSDFVYEVLRKSLQFFSEIEDCPFYKLVINCYDTQCIGGLTTARPIIFANFINRLIKISTILLKEKPFTDLNSEEIYCKYTKIVGIKYFEENALLETRLLLRNEIPFYKRISFKNYYECIIYFEMVYMSKLYNVNIRKFIISLDLNINIFELKLQFFELIHKELGTKEKSEILIYINKYGESCSSIRAELFSDFVQDGKFKVTEKRSLSEHSKEHSFVPKDLNFLKGKDLKLRHYQYDIFYGLLQFYSEVEGKNIFVRGEYLNSEPNLIFRLISVEDIPFSLSLLDYYEYTKNLTEEAGKEIEENIKRGNLHHFDDFLTLERYSFAKTEEDPIGENIKCLKLDCGHYLGYDMISSFAKSNFKCQMCNKPAIVEKYFTHMVYKTERQ